MQNEAKEAIFVGIDLGTFKTSAASSTGVQDVLCSAVGWPRDAISRTMPERKAVFGHDILDLLHHRLSLKVVRPFEKGLLEFHAAAGTKEKAQEIAVRQEAAQLLLEQAVARTCPDRDSPIYGVIGLPANVSIASRKMILEIATTSLDAVLMVSEPMAIAYGMSRLANTLIIDVGAGTIDLCLISGTLPEDEDQCTLPVGGDLIDEKLHRLLRETYPEVQLTRNGSREIKEKHGFADNRNEQVLVNLLVAGKPQPFDVAAPLKIACQAMVEPLLRGVKQVLDSRFSQGEPRTLQNVLLAGGGSRLRGLDVLIEAALQEYGGGTVTRIADPVFAGAHGALALAKDLPADCWNELLC